MIRLLLSSIGICAGLAAAQASWTKRESGVRATLEGVVWADSQFIVVGRNVSGSTVPTVLASRDGATWKHLEPKASGGPWEPSTGLQDVAYGSEGVVLAVGFDGYILSSGGNWAWWTPPSFTSRHLYGVAWGGGQFVAAGASGTVLTSEHGASWTTRGSATGRIRLTDVAWTGARYVVTGDSGFIQSSVDGVSWTQHASGVTPTLNAIAWNGSLAVVVGGNNTITSPPVILTSPDGVTWTQQATGAAGTLYGVAWTGAQFVAVGVNGSVETSPDGITWTSRAPATSAHLYAVASSGKGARPLAAAGGPDGSGGNNIIVTSDENAVAALRSGNEKSSRAAVRAGGIPALPGTIQGYRPDGRVPTATGSR
jgi:hypothetical protein